MASGGPEPAKGREVAALSCKDTKSQFVSCIGLADTGKITHHKGTENTESYYY